MFDLHSHILPGLDDGARTEEEALEMAHVASEEGTDVMVATPHMIDVNELSSPQTATNLCSQLSRVLAITNCPIKLVMGMENHAVPELGEMVRDGSALPINGTRYALVEMPFYGHSPYLEPLLYKLQAMGIVPVLAHPERIEAVQRDPKFLVRLIESGMLSQITAGSLLGHFGVGVRRFTEELVRGGLAHLIASDCHRPQGPRSPHMSQAVRAVSQLVGTSPANRMVIDTPMAILEDRSVDPGTPSPIVPMGSGTGSGALSRSAEL